MKVVGTITYIFNSEIKYEIQKHDSKHYFTKQNVRNDKRSTKRTQKRKAAKIKF
jgi:hypothetical protein